MSKISLIIFLLYLIPNPIFSGACDNIYDLSNTNCYNDVIKFDHDKFRAGHSCTNNQKNVIVEFSLNPGESNLRLLYGLKENGRYYFQGEPVYIEINTKNCVDCDNHKYRGRFESRNLFVSLNSDTSKSKQYLFSMSSYYSLAELIDVDLDNTINNNISFLAWNMTKFFGLTHSIFSYEFSLFEIEKNNTYIAAFIESAGYYSDGQEYSNTVTLKKFQFDNFAKNNHRTLLKQATVSDTYDGRDVSAFRLDDSKLIVFLFVSRIDDNNGNYKANFYDDDLNYKFQVSIWDNIPLWVGQGIFYKGISIKGDYAAFAFYLKDENNERRLIFRYVKYNSILMIIIFMQQIIEKIFNQMGFIN